MSETVWLEGASVPYQYEKTDGESWSFDTSSEACPVPMVSALIGLRQIDAPNKRLIMFNHSRPTALIDRVKDSFAIAVAQLSDGRFEIVFEFKQGAPKAELHKNLNCADK
ncbi:hypothetical protein AGMMS50229_09550 [Campylobacterota bacterium]|nr:hypothetical protein AGMMS50229_09550 [Campylobacterota bacterium]